MTRQQLLRDGTRLVTEHPIAGPLALGLGAGGTLLVPFIPASLSRNAALGTLASLVVIVAYVSSAGVGAVVKRGGVGVAGLLLAAAGMVAPVLAAVVAAAQPTADGGCSSCLADTVVFAGPFLVAMLLAPIAIGYGRARRTIPEGLAE